jgi:hypothetical protein
MPKRLLALICSVALCGCMSSWTDSLTVVNSSATPFSFINSFSPENFFPLMNQLNACRSIVVGMPIQQVEQFLRLSGFDCLYLPTARGGTFLDACASEGRLYLILHVYFEDGKVIGRVAKGKIDDMDGTSPEWTIDLDSEESNVFCWPTNVKQTK